MISILNPVPQQSQDIGGKILFGLAAILMMGGILSLAYVAYVKLDERFYQRTEMIKLASSVVMDTPQPAMDLGPSRPAIGDVIGEIQIRRIGLKAIVIEGDSLKILRRAVGHLPDTALPGQSGNIALAGHRDSLFRPLRQIRQGDVVTLDLKEQRFRYEVRSIEIVAPDNLAVLEPTIARELTLITCFPFGYIGPAPNRLIVRAREIAASR